MSIKKKLFKLNNIIYPLIFPILNFLAYFFSKITEKLYALAMIAEWARDPSPEWMDHDQDYYFQSRSKGSTFFFERGCLPKILISEKIVDKKEINSLNILDLCSGDGFYSQFFLYDISKNITLIDIDNNALTRAKDRAKKLNFLGKVKFNYINSNIIQENLHEIISKNNIGLKYDLIIFNAAIEHFKEEQLKMIFDNCKKITKPGSKIFGYTLIEDEENAFHHHELQFKSKNDLNELINKYFSNVKCFQSLSNTRHNLYFIADII